MGDSTRQRKRTAVVAATTAAVGAAAVPAVFPASAGAGPRDTCPGSTLCLWDGRYWVTPVKWFSPYGSDSYYPNNTYDSHPGVNLNDSVSAVWNNSNRWVKLCQNAGCTTIYNQPYGICVAPGGAAPDLAVGGVYGGLPVNNEMSAHYTYSSRPDHCYTTIEQQGCSI